MALKAINDKGAAYGAAVREMVNRYVSLANKIGASPLLVTCGGGLIVDTATTRATAQALIDAAPEPTDATIDAATVGLLDAADKANIKRACRIEAALRYLAAYGAARMPSNDV